MAVAAARPPHGSPPRSVWDRSFLLLAVGLSCTGHALLLGICSLRLTAQVRRLAPAAPFKLVYEDAAERQPRSVAAEALRRSTGRITIPAPGALTSQALDRGTKWKWPGSRSILDSGGERAGSASEASASFGSGRDGTIDLTDVTAAAQGDPVRLTYFSAIREQVQRTADSRDWVAGQAPAGGLVYVQVVIDRTGQADAITVLPDRSRASPTLSETAARLVTAAAPFPPFPPAFHEPRLTVLLPIEFVSGT